MDILSACFEKASNYVTREVAGETIIVPVRSNVADLDSMYTLNELGTTVWQLMDGRTSVGQIVESVCGVYEVTPEEAKKDVLDFVRSLRSAGVIRPSEQSQD